MNKFKELVLWIIESNLDDRGLILATLIAIILIGATIIFLTCLLIMILGWFSILVFVPIGIISWGLYKIEDIKEWCER